MKKEILSSQKKKEIDISVNVITVYEVLQSIYDTCSNMPVELRNKIRELLIFIDENYYHVPSGENIEILDESYKLIYEYKER